ncbi:murein transglycosylase A [Sphingosinicella sp.]|uniref:murein transglycosylase A n=1 Tax=Sphingosinicella sp. TaxID=1917971 RepID=UPI004037D4C7
MALVFPRLVRSSFPVVGARRSGDGTCRSCQVYRRNLLLAGLILALASCARVVPAPQPPPTPPPAPAPVSPPPPAPVPPPPENAVAAGVRAGPPVAQLSLSDAQLHRAFDAFLVSCLAIANRADASGLTRPEDWRALCDEARETPASPPAIFFASNFVTIEVGDGAAFATGYYEPEIRGCRTRRPGCETPVYRVPPDLLERNPLTGQAGRGRLDENGAFVPHHDRTAIEEGALAGRGIEIAWAADPIELFFLQIQGSGRLRLPDGGVMRIGYAGQNGHPYTPIGRLLRERGIIPTGVTMQRIVEWLRANPEAGRALMRENRSYVFFRELTGPGPLGSLGVPVTANASVAVDPRFVPYGAPVLLSNMDNPRADGFWVAQDTGGAIRGANRVDTFWGAGPEAATVAGGMASRGRALILIPRASWERLRDAQAQR